MLLKNKPVIFAASNESFLKYKEFFEWFKPTKVLYLNFAKIYEKKSINEMFDDIIDLDMTLFFDGLEKKEGFCVYQEGSFYGRKRLEPLQTDRHRRAYSD